MLILRMPLKGGWGLSDLQIRTFAAPGLEKRESNLLKAYEAVCHPYLRTGSNTPGKA